MDIIPVILFWGFALWGIFGPPYILLYLFFGSMVFGSFSVINPSLVGGLTLTPTPVILLLLIGRVLVNRRGLMFTINQITRWQGVVLLFLFWLVALIATMFMPRLFFGEVSIIPVRLTFFTVGEPLVPTSQNFSQFAYLSVSVLGVVAFYRLLLNSSYYPHLLNGICVGGGLVIVTGVLDLLGQYLPLDMLLDPFRTATYSLMTDVEILGSKRVVGLMPEASAYGSVALTFLCLLYFFRTAITQAWLRERLVPLLIVLLMLFIWLSTSSSAYVGLGVFALVAMIEWSGRSASSSVGSVRQWGFEWWVSWGALLSISLVVVFYPDLLTPLLTKIDELVLNKTDTGSYEERSLWTQVGWQSLLDTYGLGVGMGSTRTSNVAAAIFSNTGVLGGTLYFLFVARLLLSRSPAQSSPVGRKLLLGAKYAYFPSFIVALLAGTTADFGSANAFLYGLLLATAATPSAPQSVHKAPYQEFPLFKGGL